MNDDARVARSSLVPVLGCIALMLFGLNFYRFLDRQFFSKWKFCDRPHQHEFFVQTHRGGFHTFAPERADSEREVAAYALRRNLERAAQDLARLGELAELGVDAERLQEDIRIKAENLERLERELQQERFGGRCGTQEHQQTEQNRFQIRIVR